MRWVGYVARVWAVRNYTIIVGKPEGKIALGRPIH
jgi:hypothetical protein